MEELESAREKFLKTIRAANGYNDNYEFSENERITKENADKYKKQLKTEKTKIRRPKSKQAQKTKRFTGKQKIAALIAAGIVVVGGYIFINNQKQANEPITYGKEITQMGERPETLGISYDNVEHIEIIKDIIKNPYITDENAKKVLPKMHSEYIDVIQNKISNALEVDKEDIIISSNYVDLKNEGLKTKQTVKILSKYGNIEYYTSSDILDIKSSNNISNELADAIKDVKKVEDMMKNIQEGKFDKNSVVNEENNIIKNLSQFAAMKIEKDDRNNLIVNVTRQKDINQVNKSTNTKQNVQTDDEPEL